MAKYNMPPELYQRLRDIDRELHDILPMVDGLEECGVECQAYRDMIEQRRGQIAAAIKNFPPQTIPVG